ncbi:MAG TPA: YgaP-like transmembrane domain [Azospirillaceae bacterium]|nr:YgaP-like transmembrane domain [Azospirillaceae bacterium]
MDGLIGNFFAGEHNLSATQRGLYVAAGLGLAAAAATPRPNPLLNLLALAGGAYLAASGAYGRCPVKAALVDGGGAGRLTQAGGGQRRVARQPAYAG